MKGCFKWVLIIIGVCFALLVSLAILGGIIGSPNKPKGSLETPTESALPNQSTTSSHSSDAPRNEQRPSKASSEPTPRNSNEDLGLTMDAFNAIHTGMTYEEVKAIVGEDGEKTVDSEVAGITGQVYQWQKWTGSNMIVQFQNGRVVTKAQFGLH